MANISTSTDLVINKLSQAKYNQLSAAGLLNEYQLYITDDNSVEELSNLIDSISNDLSNKASISSLSTYLPLSGGNVDGSITFRYLEDGEVIDSITYGPNGIVMNGTSMTIQSDGNSITVVDTDVTIPCNQILDDSNDGKSLEEYLSEKADISSISSYASKVIIDDRISGISGKNDLSVVKLGAQEYSNLLTSSQLLSNALYIVDDDYLDICGEQIKNVAAPTDLSDATNKEYVDNKVSSMHIPTDLSTFSNSPGYLTKTSADSIFQPIGNYLLSDDVSISYSNQTIWLSSKAYVTSVDCADFIKDGMLSTVELCGTTLVMSFNTDAGSDPISVELSNLVDNYDSKIETLSNAIDNKIFISDNISGISGYSDLSIIKLNASEYSNLLTGNSLLSNALYIVQDDHINAYGGEKTTRYLMKYLKENYDLPDHRED